MAKIDEQIKAILAGSDVEGIVIQKLPKGGFLVCIVATKGGDKYTGRGSLSLAFALAIDKREQDKTDLKEEAARYWIGKENDDG